MLRRWAEASTFLPVGSADPCAVFVDGRELKGAGKVRVVEDDHDRQRCDGPLEIGTCSLEPRGELFIRSVVTALHNPQGDALVFVRTSCWRRS